MPPPPPIPRPRAVLLDLFHTLIVLRPGGELGAPTWEALGVPREEWHHHFFADADDRLLGTIDDPADALRAVLRRMDRAVPDERIVAAADGRMRRIENAMREVDAATVRALQRIRALGIRTALVSNAGAEEIGPWPSSPLAALFDATVFSCDVRIAKPDPRIYAEALDRIGVAAAEALFVGDGGNDELVGARRAGLTPVALTRHRAQLWPETLDEKLAAADHSVVDAAELADRLEAAFA